MSPDGSGDRRARLAPVIGAGLVALACLAGCTSSSAGHPRSSPAPQRPSTSQPPLGYRPLPSFLPTASTPVDRVVTATAAHPQLAVQGVGVRVDLPGGHVLATVTGPRVPPFVTPPPPAVTATFTITLAQGSGAVPIRVDDFTITDQLGRTFHPTLVQREAAPPSALPAIGTATFGLTAVMPTGEGRIYWAPTAHHAALVGWDFIVEND